MAFYLRVNGIAATAEGTRKRCLEHAERSRVPSHALEDCTWRTELHECLLCTRPPREHFEARQRVARRIGMLGARHCYGGAPLIRQRHQGLGHIHPCEKGPKG